MKLYAIALVAVLAATFLSGCLQGGNTATATPTLSASATPTPGNGATATPAPTVAPSATPQPGSQEEIEQVLEDEFPEMEEDESSQELEQIAQE